VIDIGGGYFSKMPPEMAEQFGGNIPSYADYAAAGWTDLCEAFPGGEPQLILEPGVGVVATTGTLVTRVLDVHCVAASGMRRSPRASRLCADHGEGELAGRA
jgi:diaminopimelate decarboxylase